ncbi:MAG TPA: matrixin family metalloprotease [Azospirillum sp.]|nr:matrixin family metalloprotease [Azospirillum sp.]
MPDPLLSPLPGQVTPEAARSVGGGSFACGCGTCATSNVTVNADGSVSVQKDYVLEGPKWGDGGMGTSGGTVTWSFAEYNYDSRETFGSTLTFLPSGYQALAQQAFNAWEQVANIHFVKVADGADVDIRLGGGSIDGSGGTLATAHYMYRGSTMTQSDIVFDSSESWSSSAGSGTYFYSVAVHEIGHAIGLDHTSVSQAIMYAYNSNQTVLHSDDISGVVALYGAAGGTATSTPTTTPTGGTGTEGNDTYIGTSGNDTTSMLGGNDYADGQGGDDVLYGNLGNDTLLGGTGADTLFGGQGNDTVSGGDGSDVLYGNLASDRLVGDSGSDTIFGGQGDDVILGGDGNDALFGNLGNDTLYGDNATTAGNAGWDTIDGGDGTDTAVFLYTRAQYTLVRAADGAVVVNDGERLYRVELIRFSDQTIETAWI